MPKKTKKEKLISEYRKKIKLLQSFQPITPHLIETKISVPEKKVGKKIILPQVNYNPTAEDKRTRHNFFTDLRKSFLIIGFILALEISLYFVSMYNNLRLGK